MNTPEEQQKEVFDNVLQEIFKPLSVTCRCEICKMEIPSEEYDANMGVCNECDRRLE